MTGRRVLACAVRECRRLLRDPNLFLVVFVAPLLYTALYGSIYLDKAEQRVPVAVVDLDRSAPSRALARAIDAAQHTAVTASPADENALRSAMAAGDVHAGVVIPAGFARDLARGRQAAVHLIVSPGRLLVLSDVGTSIAQTVAGFGATLSLPAAARAGAAQRGRSDAQPVALSWRVLHNPFLTYGDMMLPALAGIILIQLAFIGAAGATAREWSDGSWHEAFTRSGGSAAVLAAGKALAVTAIFLVFAALVRLVLFPLFSIEVQRPWLLLAAAALSFAAAGLLGVLAGTFFRHRITAFTVLGFTSYPFFMLSGYAWPAQQLPFPLRLLGDLLPSTPLLAAVKGIGVIGNGPAEAGGIFLHLGALGCGFGIAAVLRMRRLRTANRLE